MGYLTLLASLGGASLPSTPACVFFGGTEGWVFYFCVVLLLVFACFLFFSLKFNWCVYQHFFSGQSSVFALFPFVVAVSWGGGGVA